MDILYLLLGIVSALGGAQLFVAGGVSWPAAFHLPADWEFPRSSWAPSSWASALRLRN